ncbi:MAG: hypothetical protein K2M03_00560 [Muribaculaceae bacterium]|nr:hypothetical protein [Muribaculaceae bacterium]MDE6294535.1 hypothetical protein [Muribaculaceae bacterium]
MANSYNNPQAPKGMRIMFGIFMVIVYLIVGLLFILDVFNIDNQTISIVVGSILIVYGIWRGYRLYVGRQ